MFMIRAVTRELDSYPCFQIPYLTISHQNPETRRRDNIEKNSMHNNGFPYSCYSPSSAFLIAWPSIIDSTARPYVTTFTIM